MAELKIAGLQLNNIDAVSVTDRNTNVNYAINQIEKLPDSDLVILPELYTCGYSDKTFENIDILAEEINGYSIEQFSNIAQKKNCYICFGMPLLENGKKYISQIVINNDGNVECVYKKLHLAQFEGSLEKKYFNRGNDIAVFEISGIKAGIMICYDMRFPELARKLAIEYNIDFLIHPTAFYKDNTFPSWHHFIITRAMENQIYMLSINRAGNNYGHSILCPPWVDDETKPTVLDDKEGIITAGIDSDTIKKIRTKYNFRKDIRF